MCWHILLYLEAPQADCTLRYNFMNTSEKPPHESVKTWSRIWKGIQRFAASLTIFVLSFFYFVQFKRSQKCSYWFRECELLSAAMQAAVNCWLVHGVTNAVFKLAYSRWIGLLFSFTHILMMPLKNVNEATLALTWSSHFLAWRPSDLCGVGTVASLSAPPEGLCDSKSKSAKPPASAFPPYRPLKFGLSVFKDGETSWLEPSTEDFLSPDERRAGTLALWWINCGVWLANAFVELKSQLPGSLFDKRRKVLCWNQTKKDTTKTSSAWMVKLKASTSQPRRALSSRAVILKCFHFTLMADIFSRRAQQKMSGTRFRWRHMLAV